jgi:predicted anti-sigma-YlaC factor YlaD
MTRDDLVPAGLATYGALQLAQAAWMITAPGSFFDAIGPFGARNDHYTRDMATWSAALGAAMLLTALRPRWAPAGAAGALLLLAALQAGFHTVNHIVDAGAADPAWVGVFDAVALAALTAGLALLWRLDRIATAPSTRVPA